MRSARLVRSVADWTPHPTAFVLILALALLTACKVTLIGDYDEVLDKGITDLQQTAEVYFDKLLSDSTSPYDQSFHDGVQARLTVLKSRAAALPKYTIISEQLNNLQAQFSNFRDFDHSGRPINADGVKAAETAIAISIESILKLEIALKRTGAPPTSAEGQTTKKGE